MKEMMFRFWKEMPFLMILTRLPSPTNKGHSRKLTADYFVIATGSHPYHPDDIDFDNERVVDSDTILQMKELPSTLTVYGAGVIGSEYASAFKEMGIKGQPDQHPRPDAGIPG